MEDRFWSSALPPLPITEPFLTSAKTSKGKHEMALYHISNGANKALCRTPGVKKRQLRDAGDFMATPKEDKCVICASHVVVTHINSRPKLIDPLVDATNRLKNRWNEAQAKLL